MSQTEFVIHISIHVSMFVRCLMYSPDFDSVHEAPFMINGMDTGPENVFPSIIACYGSNTNALVHDLGMCKMKSTTLV